MHLLSINVSIIGKGFEVKQFKVIIDKEPSICPYCHYQNNPHLIGAFCSPSNQFYISALYQCPNQNCQSFYIAIYERSGVSVHGDHFSCTKIIGGNFKGKEFSDDINNISPQFIKIYNQALAAEEAGLTEICGIGFRKSLEFLLKDYAVKKFPNEDSSIGRMHLQDVIKKYIDDQNLKDMSSRAVWLSNDEVHYQKQWQDFNLEDVKKLIHLTLHYIEVEVLTGKYKAGIQKVK